MEELHKGEKRAKEGDTQRQTSKLKFLLLIIQIWKPPNTEEEERDQHLVTAPLVGTVMQMPK